jgi:hypothetical protein
MQGLSNKILIRICQGDKGDVYTNKDFFDLGNHVAVSRALSLLTKKGFIRRIQSGIYDFPKFNAKFGGWLCCDIYEAVRAWARKNNIRIMSSGAKAANQLGLSTQVPARIFLDTDGRSRMVKINNWNITFCHVSPQHMAICGKESEIVLQALIYTGEQYVNDEDINHLRRILSAKDKQDLINDVKGSYDWLIPIVNKIAGIKQ